MTLRRALYIGLAAGLLAFGGWKAFSRYQAAPQQQAAVQHWVCPMRCLGKVYDHPGNCPVCHMKLNPVDEPKRADGLKPHHSLWPELGGKTAIYFRPYHVRKVQADRVLRVAGPLAGHLLRARLAPEQRAGLKVGASAMVMPPQGYARPLLGTVASIGPGDTLTIRCPRGIESTPFALAEIRVPGPDLIGVPLESLSQNGQSNQVFVQLGEQFVPRAVSVTSRGESFAAVQGLHEGEVVAAAGLFWLESEWRMEHP